MKSCPSPDDMAALAIRNPHMFPNKLQSVQRIEHTLNRPRVENPEQDFYMGPIVKDTFIPTP